MVTSIMGQKHPLVGDLQPGCGNPCVFTRAPAPVLSAADSVPWNAWSLCVPAVWDGAGPGHQDVLSPPL